MNKIIAFLKENYHRIINSIAFYPVIIVLLFLLLSYLNISFDLSDQGKQLKSQWEWLMLKDASTARIIISSIAAGVITLTVFSFSMVMIVLNQTASQLSNRILDNLIGSRFQQIVLGIFIGTIVYALFLLSMIRDIQSSLQIPALSTYFLILLTVVDLFLFIYFLHYITQSVKYEVIIQRIKQETKIVLKNYCRLEQKPQDSNTDDYSHQIVANKSGIYTGFDKEELLKLCSTFNCNLYFIHSLGTFLLEGQVLLKSNRSLKEEEIEQLLKMIYLHQDESIEGNYLHGMMQLAEVAIKALSPGINDPGTAKSGTRALFELLSIRIGLFPRNVIKNENSSIFTREASFEKIFTQTVYPIWDYGQNDRWIQNEMLHLLEQLQKKRQHTVISDLIQKIKAKIDAGEREGRGKCVVQWSGISGQDQVRGQT